MDNEEYLKAAHAMQAGVAAKMNYDLHDTTPKHLRVGINAAMSDMGGLVTLLIDKGIITESEYLKAVTESMQREVKIYKDYLKTVLGVEVELI